MIYCQGCLVLIKDTAILPEKNTENAKTTVKLNKHEQNYLKIFLK